MHEWPLVIFTLLMQLAIGCVLTAGIANRSRCASWMGASASPSLGQRSCARWLLAVSAYWRRWRTWETQCTRCTP